MTEPESEADDAEPFARSEAEKLLRVIENDLEADNLVAAVHDAKDLVTVLDSLASECFRKGCHEPRRDGSHYCSRKCGERVADDLDVALDA